MENAKLKVLCILYGIGRGINTSSKSIRQNLLDPIKGMVNELDIIYILNEVAYVDNPRSGEFAAIPEIDDDIFGGEKTIRNNRQDLVDLTILAKAKLAIDVHNDNFRTYDNLLCQLGMLQEATRKKDFFSYDRILMLRDDVIVDTSKVDLSVLLKLSKNNLITTMWHWHGGISDRFALCNPSIAFRLAMRLNEVGDFVASKGYLNGEHLVKFVLGNQKQVVLACNLRLSRVRIHGIVRENFILPFWRPLELATILLAIFRFWMAKKSLSIKDLIK
ncbi:hypothetical protein OAQ72_00115 [Planktomarina temperata]|nr:hypothetical protein [Planktomarina temperata]